MLPLRYIQAAISFLVIGLAYLGYARIVVPKIEATPPQNARSHDLARNYRSPIKQYRKLIERHFPEGAWEREDNVMILRQGEFVLLLRDHEIRGDGQIEVRPCTIVRMAEKPGDRNWVMQASDRAILQTEKQQGDSSRRGFGKIVSGYLPGYVVISGSASAPGANDQVVIETRGIQFRSDRIWTPQDISFKFGQNYGKGRDLTIHLNDASNRIGPQTASQSSHPFRQIDLVHLDEALVFLPQDSSSIPVANGHHANTELVPVRVRCDGPVQMDLANGKFQISRNVVLSREPPGQPADTLECLELTADFDQLPATLSGADHGQAAIPQLILKHVVATGNPARLKTTTSNKSKDGTADSRWHTVEAAQVVYSYDGPGRLGRVQADGAGRYQSGTSNKPSQLEFNWSRRLEIVPQGTSLQLALVGSAACFVEELGTIRSDTLWLQMTSAATGPTSTTGSTVGSGLNTLRDMQPEHIVAEHDVQVESERLNAYADRLDVHFHDGQIVSQKTGKNSDPLLLASPYQRQDWSRDTNQSPSRYQVRGERLEINVARSGKEYQLRNVVMNGQVVCNELQTDPNRPSAEFNGDYFELSGLSDTRGVAQIRGAPATIRAPRMNLYGKEINVSREENRFWIEGQGSAVVQLPESIAQKHQSRQPVADIRWEGGMEFDGQTIQCRDRVNVVGPAQRIFANLVSATLTEKIDFSNDSLETDQVKLDQVVASGNVHVENREMDDSGWISVDRCQVRRLTVSHTKETIVGEGPGWIETTRRTDGMAPLTSSKSASGIRGMMFLKVKFELGFEGGLAKRQMTFKDRIEAIYGPVNNWNQRLEFGPADELVPESAVLRCQQLVAYQLPQSGGKDPFEMIAGGSATISGKAGTGQTFAARANRISYQQSKDLLMLTGDNRTEAELWLQNKIGGEPSKASAQQFKYWPKKNRYTIVGSNVLDFQVGGAQ